MIILWLIQAGSFMINALLNLLDILPDMPSQVVSVLNRLLDLFQNSINLFACFIDFNMVKILLPLVILVVNFEGVYKIIMWILRKIPILGIE